MTDDVLTHMIEHNLIPPDRRVFLWDGRLLEKMAKSKPHYAVQNAFGLALSRRLPPGLFVGSENPVRLDEMHLSLPDLVVLRGKPLDHEARYPDGRDVVLVVEVAVTSLAEDLGHRPDQYALALPEAIYIVADILHRRALVHTRPRAIGDPAGGGYEARAEVGPGGSISVCLGGVDIGPIPYEEVMR